MSTDRIQRDRGFVRASRLPRGPGGRALCRRCGTEVPRGRRTFCSDACVHEHRIRTQPSYVRQCLEERDHGVCRACGADCRAQRQAVAYARGIALRHPRALPWGDWLMFRRLVGHWEAHHIVAVVEGGGLCGLEGYATLCRPCHGRETAALRRRLSERKSNEMPALPA